MTKQRFDRLVERLDDVRAHVATGRFAGRLTEIGARALLGRLRE
jgi:hypothetical protein